MQRQSQDISVHSSSLSFADEKMRQSWLFNSRNERVKKGLSGDSGLRECSSQVEIAADDQGVATDQSNHTPVLLKKKSGGQNQKQDFFFNENDSEQIIHITTDLKEIKDGNEKRNPNIGNTSVTDFNQPYKLYKFESNSINVGSLQIRNQQQQIVTCFHNLYNLLCNKRIAEQQNTEEDEEDDDGQDNESIEKNTQFKCCKLISAQEMDQKNVILSETNKKEIINHILSSKDITKMKHLSGKGIENKRTIQFIINLKKIVKEFVMKLKHLKQNRRWEGLTSDQLAMINDQSYYQQLKQRNKLVYFFECLFSSLFESIPHIPVFIPTHKLLMLWNFFSLVYFYIFCYVLSISMFFDQDNQINSPSIYKYCVFSFMLMVVDIIISLNTAFFNRDMIIIERKIIIQHYLISSHFFSDFASLLCLGYKLAFESSENYLSFQERVSAQFYSFLVFLKLYDLTLKKSKLESIIVLKIHQRHLYRLFTQIFSLLVIAHIGSIGWYLQGQVYSFYHPNANNWMKQINIQDEAYYVKYIYSFYWAMTTLSTVGYGDITAQNSTEAMYASINIILFSIMFAYSINNIGSILHDFTQQKKMLQDSIQIIEKYMKRKQINIHLKSRVKAYLHFLHEELIDQNEQEEKQILSKLSNKLRDEITVEANSQIIQKFDIFKKFSQNSLRKIVFIMKEQIVSPNEVIFKEGESNDHSLYLIQKGIIQIYQSSSNNSPSNCTTLSNLSYNQSFGEISFFTGQPRTASARSKFTSTIYKIDRSEFIELISTNSQDFESFKMIQDKIIFQNQLSDINVKCFSCKKNGHISSQCPLIHQNFDKQCISLRSNFSLFQERSSSNRFEKKSFNPKQIQFINSNNFQH